MSRNLIISWKKSIANLNYDSVGLLGFRISLITTLQKIKMIDCQSYLDFTLGTTHVLLILYDCMR